MDGLRRFGLLFLALLLPACGSGGGGGGGGSGLPPTLRPRVYFQADKNTVGTNELFAVLDDDTVVNLSGVPVPGGNLLTWRPSFDGKWVAFVADKDMDEVEELYVAPSTGGPAVKVSGAMVAGGDVYRIVWWSPDSSRVLFLADREVDETFELYTATPTGLIPNKVSGTLVPGGDVYYASFGWAGSRIVYAADQNVDGQNEIFSVAPDGSGAVELTESVSATARSIEFDVSPDGLQVALFAVSTPGAPEQIYAVPASGGAPVTFSGGLAGGVIRLAYRGWSPDQSKYAYVENAELYTINVDGTNRTKVSTSTVFSGSMSWSPDSAYLLYRFGLTAQAGVAGSEVDVVNPLGGGETLGFIGWSTKGHGISYSKGGAAKALFVTSAGVAGGGTQISATPGWAVDVGLFMWVENDTSLVFVGDETTDGFLELYKSPLAGSPHVNLSSPALEGGILAFYLSYDSTTIYFSACREVAGTFELYSIPAAGGALKKLSGPMVAGGRVGFLLPAH